MVHCNQKMAYDEVFGNTTRGDGEEVLNSVNRKLFCNTQLFMYTMNCFHIHLICLVCIGLYVNKVENFL